MGTEISISHEMNTFIDYVAVKLNNPLMGTEITSTLPFIFFLSDKPVKLNNPLMGTEIHSNPSSCIALIYSQLN